MTIKADIDKKIPDSLKEYFKKIPKAALAFSGGVDSSYLLYAAAACGVKVHAYYVKSQFQPQFELGDAQRIAEQVGAEMTIIPLDALKNAKVVENPCDRCYYCKQVIFNEILKKAQSDGYNVLMDGTNASDDAGDRPGMKALRELNVLSPLRESGITKLQVREASKNAGLFTWDKPAYACLATRIPHGTALGADTLMKVEKAENKLFDMGFTDFRARVLGDGVKLQLPAGQFEKLLGCREQIVKELSVYFKDVLLDLKAR